MLNVRRSRIAVAFAGLLLAVAGLVAACDLNPQPLPPGDNASTGAGNNNADASNPTESPAPEGAADGGTFNGSDAANLANDGGGGGADAGIDAAREDGGDAGEAGDASEDGGDAGEDASDAGTGPG
jgi:hypothetical protein